MHMTDTGAQPMSRPAPSAVPRERDAGVGRLALPSLEALLDWLETRR